MIKSCLSPDGKYLVSGSETGIPYLWDAETEDPINDTDQFECNFMDVVSDCAWNPRYNMFALSGFGQEFPILVYVFQREHHEIEELMFRMGGQLSSQNMQANELNDPQNQEQLYKDAQYKDGYGKNYDVSIFLYSVLILLFMFFSNMITVMHFQSITNSGINHRIIVGHKALGVKDDERYQIIIKQN